jgi:hypothetical protein
VSRLFKPFLFFFNLSLRNAASYAGAIVLSVTYGYDVAPKNDHLVTLLESTRPAFSLGTSPRWMINTFPILRYIPRWLPGTGFKNYASSVKKVVTEQREAPFKYTADSLVCFLFIIQHRDIGIQWKPIGIREHTHLCDLQLFGELSLGYGCENIEGSRRNWIWWYVFVMQQGIYQSFIHYFLREKRELGR